MMKGFGVLPVIMIPSSLVGPLLIRKTWINSRVKSQFFTSAFMYYHQVFSRRPLGPGIIGSSRGEDRSASSRLTL